MTITNTPEFTENLLELLRNFHNSLFWGHFSCIVCWPKHFQCKNKKMLDWGSYYCIWVLILKFSQLNSLNQSSRAEGRLLMDKLGCWSLITPTGSCYLAIKDFRHTAVQISIATLLCVHMRFKPRTFRLLTKYPILPIWAISCTCNFTNLIT